MKISKRGEYALRALIDIGIAGELGHDLVQIRELAEQERLPTKFLEQILMQLKAAGFIDSKRGKKGGYFIKMPLNKIKFGMVIRLIDGPLAPISCVSQTAYERCTCPDEEHCGLRMLMLDVRNMLADLLDRYTLQDSVDMTLHKMKKDKVPLPFLMKMIGGAQRVNDLREKKPPQARKGGRKKSAG
ncbi:MAG TPA: Rrf2 family transcriptional regulator [Chthoniobacteraceae bacterium]|nr:Rrf2 family transcriptional regulator [Chthoniobacteraceae bacterium]